MMISVASTILSHLLKNVERRRIDRLVASSGTRKGSSASEIDISSLSVSSVLTAVTVAASRHVIVCKSSIFCSRYSISLYQHTISLSAIVYVAALAYNSQLPFPIRTNYARLLPYSNVRRKMPVGHSKISETIREDVTSSSTVKLASDTSRCWRINKVCKPSALFASLDVSSPEDHRSSLQSAPDRRVKSGNVKSFVVASE